MPKHIAKEPPKNAALVLLLFVFVIIVLGIVVTLAIARVNDYQKFNAALENPNEELPPVKKAYPESYCKQGTIPKEEFLKQYTVKRGDSLLKIARDVVGDVSRLGELINLNKDRYPHITDKSSFIEQGFRFYLPPDYAYSTSGYIYSFYRTICEMEPHQILTANDCSQGQSGHTIDSLTVFEGKPQGAYQSGDCAVIVVDSNRNRLVKITPQ